MNPCTKHDQIYGGYPNGCFFCYLEAFNCNQDIFFESDNFKYTAKFVVKSGGIKLESDNNIKAER